MSADSPWSPRRLPPPHKREFAQLDAYRLRNNLTWNELAEQMTRVTKTPVKSRTLHYLLMRLPPNARPLDRTMFTLRKFLVYARGLETRRRRAAAARAAAAPVTPEAPL